MILNPGDQIQFPLPDDLKYLPQVAINPRIETQSWLLPSIVHPVNGCVFLINSSNEPINVKKSSHLADIRDTTAYDLPKQVRFVIDQKQVDSFQYKNFASVQEPADKYLHLIQVDPDNVLSEDDRQIFHALHQKFAHLFTPLPGKYNGHIGQINNRLQFSSPPAPNSRTHIPNYSPSLNKILAEKMDDLEQWGVLVEPEKLGITVEFVSSSMLVPKPEPNEYRLVTDFGALNVYLKRVPNTSATISQAKSRIARARHVIHLDFSNYFYQNGMQKIDVQYLGTVHPYKGLRVYTCDPQGLKGASERGYEKLVTIFGDMIQWQMEYMYWVIPSTHWHITTLKSLREQKLVVSRSSQVRSLYAPKISIYLGGTLKVTVGIRLHILCQRYPMLHGQSLLSS